MSSFRNEIWCLPTSKTDFEILTFPNSMNWSGKRTIEIEGDSRARERARAAVPALVKEKNRNKRTREKSEGEKDERMRDDQKRNGVMET